MDAALPPLSGVFRAVAALTFGAAWAFYLWLGVSNPYVGFVADDAVYLLMADLYSPLHHAVGAVYAHIRGYSHLPPFFPLIISLAGGGTEHLAPARVVVATAMAFANGLFGWWLLRRTASPWHALGLALVVGLLPGTLLLVVDVFSEGLYLALCWLILLTADRIAIRPRWPLLLALGVVAGCAVGTRTIGIALLPALAMLAPRLGWRRSSLVVIGFVCLALPLTRLSAGDAAPSYFQIAMDQYRVAPFAVLGQQLNDASTALHGALPYGLFQWRDVHAPWRNLSLMLLLGLGIGGMFDLIRRRQLLSCYVVAYLGIVLLWPFANFMERFVMPLAGPLLYFAYHAAVKIHARAGTAFIAFLACLLLPAWMHTVQALATPPDDPKLSGFRTTRYWIDLTRRASAEQQIKNLGALHDYLPRLAEVVPADACLFTQYPQITMYRAKRTAWLIPPPADLLKPAPWACPYVHALADTGDGEPPFYPLDVVGRRAVIVDSLSVRPGDQNPRRRVIGMLVRDRLAQDRGCPVTATCK
ncbi:MAG: hypothetical protein HYX63_08825 [Gammaproteobacteria bacterium]|nr:hypothetical protein [Gammaproteobacteria bacterium]